MAKRIPSFVMNRARLRPPPSRGMPGTVGPRRMTRRAPVVGVAPTPVVTITAGPSITRLSRMTGMDVITLSFQSDIDYSAYEIRLVNDPADPESVGSLLESGPGGTANTPQSVDVTDDELVTGGGTEGANVVKVFVQANGVWSAQVPAYFTATLDTVSPAGVTASINGGAAAASVQDVSLAVATSDSPTTGYQVKIWGDVDVAANPSIQTTEGASSWITLASPHSVRLSSGDGLKTINARVRDDVWNESGIATDTITLDTTLPIVSITVGPDVTKVSKISGKRTINFSFSSDSPFDQFKVKVVPSTASNDAAGTTIGTTNGSTGTSGSAGGYAASTNRNVTIDGRDLEAASPGDGAKVIKVFVQESGSGLWSA